MYTYIERERESEARNLHGSNQAQQEMLPHQPPLPPPPVAKMINTSNTVVQNLYVVVHVYNTLAQNLNFGKRGYHDLSLNPQPGD